MLPKSKFIIKRKKSLAEYKIKIKIDQLLFKYKHRNGILERRKQEHQLTTQICLSLATKIRFKKLSQICCSSKIIYLLHVEKYKTTVHKQ